MISWNTELDAITRITYYRSRFKIEFLLRDIKRHRAVRGVLGVIDVFKNNKCIKSTIVYSVLIIHAVTLHCPHKAKFVPSVFTREQSLIKRIWLAWLLVRSRGSSIDRVWSKKMNRQVWASTLKKCALLALVVVTASCGQGDSEVVIATVGDKKITQQQFDDYLALKRVDKNRTDVVERHKAEFLRREALTLAIEQHAAAGKNDLDMKKINAELMSLAKMH